MQIIASFSQMIPSSQIGGSVNVRESEAGSMTEGLARFPLIGGAAAAALSTGNPEFGSRIGERFNLGDFLG